MNDKNRKSRITETTIGGTVYIVESLVSSSAKETAYNKVKRLILSNINSTNITLDTLETSTEYNSTSAK